MIDTHQTQILKLRVLQSVPSALSFTHTHTMPSELDTEHEKSIDLVVNSTEDETSRSERIGTEGLESIRTLLSSQAPVGQQSPKQIGLSFKGLSVAAASTAQTSVKTLPRAILNTFGPDQVRFVKENILARLFPKPSTKGSKILEDFSGLVKPGEMLLVLGRPGSGCSTFLRSVANRSPLAVTGDVEYGSVQAAVFKRDHARETIYLPEEDKHVASLTVRQTIWFALRNSLPTEARNSKTVADLVEVIAKLCGLSHALDTPVGGQFSPGVSGGERKR
jgi:ATP-binding cassette subfamily G (WHITE) protein 2 (SNQ2)